MLCYPARKLSSHALWYIFTWYIFTILEKAAYYQLFRWLDVLTPRFSKLNYHIKGQPSTLRKLTCNSYEIERLCWKGEGVRGPRPSRDSNGGGMETACWVRLSFKTYFYLRLCVLIRVTCIHWVLFPLIHHQCAQFWATEHLVIVIVFEDILNIQGFRFYTACG